jgi:hypothetical protein
VLIVQVCNKGESMADTESILQLGIEAARAGDKAEARELFRLVTREKPDSAQGWLWLAGVAEDRDEKRTALEHVIELDPTNDLARKGLAAMAGATTVAATTAKPESLATSASDAEVATAMPSAEILGVSSDTPDGVRTYNTPASPTDDDNWTPTFADDDFDLQDHQQRASDDDEYEPGVVVEEEVERRGGIGWLPWALGLVAIALMVYLAFDFFRNNDNAAQAPGGVDSGVTIGTTSTAVEGGIAGGGTEATTAGGEAGVAPIAGTNIPGDAGITAVPVEQTAVPVIGEQTVPPGDQVPAAEPAPAEQTAPPAEQPVAPAEQTAPPVEQPVASVEGGGTPAEQPTVIVVVPPDATVVPPVLEEATAVPAPAEAAPVEAAPPAAAPVDAAPPASAPPATGGGNVAAANPAIVPQGTLVQAGAWGFQYTGAQNVSTGAFGNAPPSQGQYQIIVVNVANGSGQAAAIPDGFFVMKDAQGRVYEFNRAASIDYVNRYGRGQAADISADEQVAPTNTLVSVGLLFDVAPDATNLVLLSRENINEGFLVR